MPAILLGLIALAAVAFGIAWFLRANPSTLARLLRPILVVLGAIGVGGLLIFGLRFLPGLLPELMGLAGVVIAALIARAARHRPSGGFSSPGTGQRTEVRTAFLQAWIDHATGDVGGTVLSGRFAGRTLDSLSDSDLLGLHAECASDPELAQSPGSLPRSPAGWGLAQRPPSAAVGASWRHVTQRGISRPGTGRGRHGGRGPGRPPPPDPAYASGRRWKRRPCCPDQPGQGRPARGMTLPAPAPPWHQPPPFASQYPTDERGR